MPEKIQVLIAGAGPVGLTLAAELMRRGVTVRLIDQAAERSALSKALVLWPRTLELLHAAGAVEPFLAAGKQIIAANIFAGKHRLARAKFDHVDSPYPFALVIAQSETERLLEAHLQRLGGTVERRCALAAFRQHGEGVVATLRHGDGREESVRADWLVGCDGAHSVVRHALGLPFAGTTEPFTFMLADVALAGPVMPHELSLFWHSSGVLAIFPFAPGRFRVVADLGAAAAAPGGEPTLADVQAALDERGPGGIIASNPTWLSRFHINERKVEDYRIGRVFLAGDAAHVHSPVGGQGMNTGMHDACNLAWKLALVCRGAAQEGLLDSYSSERSAIGRMVLRNAAGMTRIVTLRNPLARSLRNLATWLLAHATPFPRRFAATMAEISIAYPASPLSRLAPHASAAAPRPGERAPDATLAPPLGDKKRLYDVLGSGKFTLLASAAGAALDGLAARHAAQVMPVLVAPGPYRDDSLYLIRPDGYVGLVARREDGAAVDSYLSDVLAAA